MIGIMYKSSSIIVKTSLILSRHSILISIPRERKTFVPCYTSWHVSILDALTLIMTYVSSEINVISRGLGCQIGLRIKN